MGSLSFLTVNMTCSPALVAMLDGMKSTEAVVPVADTLMVLGVGIGISVGESGGGVRVGVGVGPGIAETKTTSSMKNLGSDSDGPVRNFTQISFVSICRSNGKS